MCRYTLSRASTRRLLSAFVHTLQILPRMLPYVQEEESPNPDLGTLVISRHFDDIGAPSQISDGKTIVGELSSEGQNNN